MLKILDLVLDVLRIALVAVFLYWAAVAIRTTLGHYMMPEFDIPSAFTVYLAWVRPNVIALIRPRPINYRGPTVVRRPDEGNDGI